MDLGNPTILAASVGTVSVIAGLFLARRANRARKGERALAESIASARDIPKSLHPVIDPDLCIGSLSCLKSCPEGDILGLVGSAAALVHADHGVGHGRCAAECPVGAIQLVFGTASRGVELPKLDANFQTTRPGVYVIGELGGMGLIRNAVSQGKQAASHVASTGRRGKAEAWDAVVVGGGPAGMSATLKLMEEGYRVMLLERDSVGGTIMHYPRAKVVMTGALEFSSGIGTVKRRTMSKEELVELWQSIIEKSKMNVQTKVTVESVNAEHDGMWRLDTTAGPVRAANVLLALGRRGNPRKLGVPGEDLPKVSYTLLEPDPFQGKHVLVVGGGNSAVENAIALADFGRCASVAISYRRAAFARCRAENRRRIDELIQSEKVIPIMPSELRSIHEGQVILDVEGRETAIANDAVIVQIGGTAPAELLQKFGIQVVTKRGEA